MDEQNPLEDLIHIIQILMEEPDKLQKVIEFGAKMVRDFFIFTCLGECQETYAINIVNGGIYLLNHINSIPETGNRVRDQDEVKCIIECLLEFIQNTPEIKPADTIFMQRLNPKSYTPGSCFSPC